MAYDHDPNWKYEFPTPAVDLRRTESLVAPPALVRAVGVDGRYEGSLRRFPGFRLVRDMASDISGLSGIDRVWYAAIKKGITSSQLRGFVVLADSSTATYKALYFVYYDTDTSAWTSATLIDFGTESESPFSVSVVRGQVFDWQMVDEDEDSASPTHRWNGYAWNHQNGTIIAWAGITTGSTAVNSTSIHDGLTGLLISRIPATPPTTFVTGGAQGDTSSIYTAGFTATPGKLLRLDLSGSTATWATIGDFTGLAGGYRVWDLGYDSDSSVLYAIATDGTDSILYSVNVSTGALTSIGTVAPQKALTGIDYGRDDSLMYVSEDTDLYTINLSTAAVTAVAVPSVVFSEADNVGPRLVVPSGGGSEFLAIDDQEASGTIREVNPDANPETFESVDVTSTDRFIYACFTVAGNRRPYNRTYYWDFDTSQIQGRDAGFKHTPLIRQYASASASAGVIADDRRVSYLFRSRHRAHNLISPYTAPQRKTTGTTASNTNRVVVHTGGVTGGGSNHSGNAGLEISGWEYEVFRTIGLHPDLTTEDTPLLSLLLPDIHWNARDADTAGALGRDDDLLGAARSDRELTARLPLDFIHDFVGLWPRTKRVVIVDDQLFIISTPLLGNPQLQDSSQRPTERIMWSPPDYRKGVENFRGAVTGEQFRPDNPAVTMHGLKVAGDYVIALTSHGIVRLHKSGAFVAVNPLTPGWGAVSRDGAATLDAQVFVVSPQGLIALDLRTMSWAPLAKVQRLFTTAALWRGSLASVQATYDAELGALCLLNTSTEEAYLLWPQTGGLTSLEDCPFAQVLEGADPETPGPQRTFWVTAGGKVLTPDAEEASNKKTMYGGSSGDTVNGTATGGSTTTLDDSGASFAATAKEFYVHFLSGDNAGSKRQISAVTGTQLTWTSALPAVIASGDRYAVAPIPFRVRGHQLSGQRGLDQFIRKIVTGITANIDLLGGETTSANVNLRMTYKAYRHVGDASPTEVSVIMDEDVTRMAGALQAQDTILFPEWVCLSSNLDFQLLSGRVSGKMTSSRAISGPVSVT